MRKREDFKILNIGCGQGKLNHAWNIDADGSVYPDEIVDISKGLPYPNGSFESILCFHTMEHIPKKFHSFVMMEMHRVLADEGELFISYPEFKSCATNYIENKQGKREFWEATIYGRQTTPWDAHLALMDSEIFCELAKRIGFELEGYMPEPGEAYNTHLQLKRGAAMETYEDILKKEIFHE